MAQVVSENTSEKGKFFLEDTKGEEAKGNIGTGKKVSMSTGDLIHNYRIILSKRAKANEPIFAIEQLFIDNQLVKIFKKNGKTLVFKMKAKFFKKKDFLEYKAQRDPSAIPIDFSSSSGVPVKISKSIHKFFKKRYYLFSKFDEGIQLDEESNAYDYYRLVFSNTRRSCGIHSENMQVRMCFRWICRCWWKCYPGIIFIIVSLLNPGQEPMLMKLILIKWLWV